jgi:hypothetical protein
VHLAVLALAISMSAAATGAEPWDPRAWEDEGTLELRTQAPGEPEHWSKVWLVVLDGDVYVRLGGRAASRIETNVARPLIGVRVGGRRFDRVRGVPSPESVERVAQAMAAKYSSDWFIRWFAHPLTLRLLPEPPGRSSASSRPLLQNRSVRLLPEHS